MHVPYHIVVEPQEYAQYAAVIHPAKILVLPFSNLGQGSIPARNWIWEHAKTRGASRHWILDDNIRCFYRLYQNQKIRVIDGVCFRVLEDFVERYSNIPLAGLQYQYLAKRKQRLTPVIFNTRIYSCILIANDLALRWRGRYNEDTDLSLRVLKAGYCTVLCQAFLCDKITTLTMKGGNTDELYQGDGRLRMAQSLQRQHPDVTRIVWRWGRYQHLVNYSPFKRNQPRLKSEMLLTHGPNEYGMHLVSKAAL